MKHLHVGRVALFVLTLLPLVVVGKQDRPATEKGQLRPARVFRRSPLALARRSSSDSTVIFTEDFETPIGSWMPQGDWQIGHPTAGPGGGHDSPNCAGTNLSGPYSDNADDRLVSPPISLPASTERRSTFELFFWHWYELESDNDYGKVEISLDNGNSWRELAAFTGKDDWRESLVDLTPYAGHTVRLAFHLTSDFSRSYAGWYVDDVRIVMRKPAPLEATVVALDVGRFPFVYVNVIVDSFGVRFLDLPPDAFRVYENGELQADRFGVAVPQAESGVRLVDIVFLMDNSGSMEDEQNAVRTNVMDFVDNLVASGVNYALGLCRFGAEENGGHPIIEDNGVLTTDAQYFKNSVWSRNTVVGRYEPGWDALYESARQFEFRPGAQRIFILITDETVTADGNSGRYSQQETTDILKSNSITVFALVDSTNTVAHADYGVIARETNGSVFNIICPFDQILCYITRHVASTYVLHYCSSNPVPDGSLRTVHVVVVDSKGDTAVAEGAYVPGAAPTIQRTLETMALQVQSWPEGSELEIAAQVTDNTPPYVQAVMLHYRTTGESFYQTVSMRANRSGISEVYTATIPSTAVRAPGIDYYITATDGQNSTSDPATDPAASPYQIAVLPNVAPLIQHDPPLSLPVGNPLVLKARVQDNTDRVDSVKVHYRRRGDLVYRGVIMRNVGDDNYEATIPAEAATAVGLEYYIEAIDNFGLVSTFGTRNAPIIVGDPLGMVNEKRSLINFFLNDAKRYMDEEREAQQFVDQVEQDIQGGTADAVGLEALQRLTLVERMTKVVYPDAVNLANLSGKATRRMTASLVLAGAVQKLEGVLSHWKSFPILKGLYKATQSANRFFVSSSNRIQHEIYGHIWGKLWPWVLSSSGHLTKEGAQSLSSHVVWDLIRAGREATKEGAQDAEKLLGVDQKVGSAFLNVYENGIGGNVLKIGYSARAVSLAVQDARTRNFQAENMSEIARTIQTVRQTEMVGKNRAAQKSAETLLSYADLASKASLVLVVVALIGSIIAMVAGMAGCPGTGGLGCALAALGGVGFHAAVHAAMNLLTAAQIGFDASAAGVGLVRLEITLPRELVETYQTAFAKGSGGATGASVARADAPDATYALTAVAETWVDSLDQAAQAVQNRLQELRGLVGSGQWGNVRERLDAATPDLDRLLAAENVAGAYTDVAYAYNADRSTQELDSLYIYSGAAAAANDLSMGLSLLSVGLASATEPSGAEVDTLLMALDTTAVRLARVPETYRKALQGFMLTGFQVPPIVALADQEVVEENGTHMVRCTVKNVSTTDVHDVAVSLRPSEDVRVDIQALSDTLFQRLAPHEERTVQWRLRYRGSQPAYLLDLQVHPLSEPGGFVGTRTLIQISLLSSSPPTPGSLGDKNVYAYPNPFNPSVENVTFRFRLAKQGKVTLRVYDVANRVVATVARDVPMAADRELSLTWNGRNDLGELVANGVYFYRITTSSGEKATGKVAVLR